MALCQFLMLCDIFWRSGFLLKTMVFQQSLTYMLPTRYYILCDICDKCDVTFLAYIYMWQTWFDMCDNPGICDRSDVFEIYYICDKRNVTYAANAMWLMWQVLPMRCYICDKCDVTYLTYMTYVTTRFDICDIYDICDICDVYGNSDVTYATNAMWVLWQMRSDICDIFDKCDIYDKRNVTYMAYVNFRGWTLQENSLNWLEMSYLKSNQIKSCSCHVYDWLPTQIGLIMNLWKVAHFRSMNMCGMINSGVLLCE